MRFRLESVRYIPAQLEPGVLYVSREFEIAVHLCACGCGTKIRTPLGATEWSVKKTKNGPILDPSVGNWQEPCRSHYWIHPARLSGPTAGLRSKSPQAVGVKSNAEQRTSKPESAMAFSTDSRIGYEAASPTVSASPGFGPVMFRRGVNERVIANARF